MTGRKFVALVGGTFLDIADIEYRLGGQEAQHLERSLLLGLALHEPGGLAVAQQHQGAFDEIELLLGFLVGALGLLLQRLSARFSRLSRSASISSVSMVSISAADRSCPRHG
jgi:hypothetical protein